MAAAGGCATLQWLKTHAWSVVAVISPTTPVTGPKCADVWNLAAERCVPEPNAPSALVGMPTAVSHR
jgi:hypothetical protein